MTQLIIDKKKYVLLPAEEYQALQKSGFKNTTRKTPDLHW